MQRVYGSVFGDKLATSVKLHGLKVGHYHTAETPPTHTHSHTHTKVHVI